MDLVVLSPHLDDGVFACGGHMAQARSRGERVVLATFGTRPPEHDDLPESLAGFLDYDARLAEEQRAAALLDVESRSLGFVERVVRKPVMRRLHQVFGTPASADQLDALPQMRETIAGLLDELPGARLLAPLGIGNHFDHVEVFVAAVCVMVERGAYQRFGFYEDSYGLGRKARAQHFLAKRRSWPVADSPERASWRLRLLFGALAVARRGPPVETLLPAAAQQLSWQVASESIAPWEEQKLAAVCCYDSQVAMLGGDAAWCEALRRYHRIWQGGEPIWSAAAPETGGG